MENSKCRICLQEDVIMDWNNYLQNHDHLTYKDCYYKYTQLNCCDGNNLYLSTMLCCNCSKSLENIHAFITKALETHNFFHELLPCEGEYDNKDVKIKFETILISEPGVVFEPEMQNVKESEDNETSIRHNSVFESPTAECLTEKSNWIINEYDEPVKNRESDASSITENHGIKQLSERISTSDVCGNDKNKAPLNELQCDTTITKKKNSSKPWEIPTCCSICSKLLTSKYKAIQHEQTHIINRERNEVCPDCGMKFYNKGSLRCHVLTHNKNREKSHKCEFCDKAFYNSGGLNIHRRIHLGQMIKCTFCTKEYYRQVDLDKHMISHSASKVSENLKIKKKYFVRCEICEVNIRSNQYKEHYAKHINEPLAKCAICNKEFFSRHSCVRHLKNFHKKSTAERKDYLIAYKTTYYSNLFLQQNVGEIFTK